MNHPDLPVSETGSDGSFLDCWYLTGATASGKTGAGIELALRIDAEIISLDSMALYREMDIGTDKPAPQQRQRVPHHLLDVLSPREEFSVSNYLEAARRTVAEIRGRGREVLFVGGTPLYLKALLRGLFRGPPADWEFRRAVEEELVHVGLPALYERLQQVDPLSAAKLHPHDKRRIIRALEVYRATGRPISHLQTQFEDAPPADRCHVFVLSWPRELLHERINRRVEAMFAAGFVDEVRSLLERHGQLSRTALQAVGYREVIGHLRGEQELAATIEAVKARTRQFARHQETWFRNLSECRFVPLQAGWSDTQVAEQILQLAGTPWPRVHAAF
jgi:tRNA dimethylallyltransferase